MPLWLDMLRTPMAAPETAELRRLRRTWQILCLSLGASVLALQPLLNLLGRAAPCVIAALLVAALLTTALYIARNVMRLDPSRPTPAVYRADGLDYVATDKRVLFGHHFAAIAGAGAGQRRTTPARRRRCGSWPRW